MTRLTSSLPLLVAAAICGCACGGAGAHDAGFDTGVDAGEGGLAVPEYRFELDVDRRWDGTCADWEAIGHPEPAPGPGGSPPSTLWVWDPRADPLTADLGTLEPFMANGPSISPDGSVWAVGPNGSHVMAIERSGSARFATRLVDIPMGFANRLYPPVAMAPDGTGFVSGDRAGSRALWHIGVDGTDIGAGYSLTPVMEPTMGGYGSVTIGPGGRVYVPVPDGTGGTTIVATCRGFPIWRLRVHLTLRAPTAWSGYALLSGMMVGADGLLYVGVQGSAEPMTVTDAGEVSWPFGIVPAPAGSIERLVFGSMTHVSNDRWRIGERYTAHVVEMPERVRIWETPWRRPGDVEATGWLDAAGRLWLRYDGGSRPDRLGVWALPATAPLWLQDEPDPGIESFFLTDTLEGDIIATRYDRMVRIDGADGATSWAVQVTPTNPVFGEHVLDVDGRLYGTMPGGFVGALQTDALPPRGTFCLSSCNRHRNRWAHDYDPWAGGPAATDGGVPLDAGVDAP